MKDSATKFEVAESFIKDSTTKCVVCRNLYEGF